MSETVYTAYGEMDIELCECHSCGEKIPEEDAIAVRAPARIRNRMFGEVEVTGGHRRNFCEFCAESLLGVSHGRGAIPSTAWKMLTTRVANTDDMFFGFFCGLFGAFVGTFVASVVIEVLAWTLTAVMALF